MITVVYRKRDGTDKHQEFNDPSKAFDKFYSMANIAWRAPFIWTPDHIGSFDYRNIEWYMTKDQEGKNLAFNRFIHWFNSYKRCKD